MLVDYQINRVGSPALDLNYLFYCSLAGDVRRKNMTSFFASYYSTFASVVAGGSVVMPFTLPQLYKECKNKNMFGLLMSQIVIPVMLMEAEDAPDMEDFVGENLEEKMEKFTQQLIKMLTKSPDLRPRMLDLFDEMVECGTIVI